MRYTAFIRAARARDTHRFRPNPKGDGYLTRHERWFEVARYFQGR
jgi:hypothetical protein